MVPSSLALPKYSFAALAKEDDNRLLMNQSRRKRDEEGRIRETSNALGTKKTRLKAAWRVNQVLSYFSAFKQYDWSKFLSQKTASWRCQSRDLIVSRRCLAWRLIGRGRPIIEPWSEFSFTCDCRR